MTYIEPLLLIFITLGLVGLAMRSPRGRHLGLAGVLGLFLISWPPVDWLIAQPLQADYPVRSFVSPPGLQAIVVLGSAVDPPQFERPYPLLNRETFERCRHAAWIFQQRGTVPVLACEGRPRTPIPGSPMREFLRDSGVPDGMIWTEDESRSTHENAVYGARILRAHGVRRIALVTDAQSMPRAAGCFRKEGMEVAAAPIEFRTLGLLIDEAFPSWRAIRRNEITLHEIAGLAWYRMRGWI